MGMRLRAAWSQACGVWIRKKKRIFLMQLQAEEHFYNDVWGAGARVVAVFLVVINRIYLHHNLERLIYAPSFSGIKCLRDKRRKPGLVNGCTYLGEKWEADCISIHMYYLRRFEVFCIRATQLLRNAFSVHLGMHFRKFSENKHLHGLKN